MKKTKLKIPSSRQVSAIAFMLCFFLLAASAYFQFNLNLEPCPLCVLQRIFVLGLGLIFLFYPLHKPGHQGRQVYHLIALIFAMLGIGIAGRHVWLQSLPPHLAPPCGASLNEIIANLPLADALTLILRGSGDCAKVTWQFLHLSMPAWTLLFFILFMFVAVWQMLRKE